MVGPSDWLDSSTACVDRGSGGVSTDVGIPEEDVVSSGVIGSGIRTRCNSKKVALRESNRESGTLQNTMVEFTSWISKLRNKLGHRGFKDEGLIVKPKEGAEAKLKGNLLVGDKHSLAYDRTPEEILRIVYGTSKESKTGRFYPKGGDGRIAKYHLRETHKSQDYLFSSFACEQNMHN
ncbi:hypothetical protein RND71_001999 [Anisodus tanguticus]|uniref:Uncharacterized protein n=1 Tax=Anisodus tanguticus TaxID=243964 RepID=A0AAE1VSP5_9SOLA|nr:hypothetical protein RND71_001999 [Anisodus tanguticus]